MDGRAAADHEPETPRLRVARYLPDDDAGPNAEDTASSTVNWPRISDYWPTAPQQIGPPADYYEIPSAEPQRTGAALFTQTPPPPVAATPARSKRGRVWTVVSVLVVLSATVGGGILLTRSTPHSDGPPQAAPLARVASMAPMPPGARGSTPASGNGTSPVPATATLELVSNTTEWVVRAAPLGDRGFQVSTPTGAGVTARGTLTGGVLRVTVTRAGSGGSGRVDVLLSDRITWRLRMTGGAKRASFDMSRATVSRIDLTGGASTIDLTLGRLAATVPIRMSGGVHSWRIETRDAVPARVIVRRGAGSVVLNGLRRDGVRRGTTVRSGNLNGGAGVDVDAVGGIGSLQIARG